jgi:hypothetical protein
VISGTTLYVEAFGGVGADIEGGLDGFDANGVTDCGGTPITCAPVWTGGGPTLLPPLVANGVAFSGFSTGNPFGAFELGASEWLSSTGGKPVAVGGSVVFAVGATQVEAFDAAGNTGCAGSPKTCGPLWSVPGTGAIVGNGSVYVSTSNTSGQGEIVAYGLP